MEALNGQQTAGGCKANNASQSDVEEPVISATKKAYQRQVSSESRQAETKSILKRSTLGAGTSLAKTRSPLMQFRQKGTFYKPLFEMFLCYGQEEFFDCRGDSSLPGAATALNFADMLEQRHRRDTRI